LFSQAKGAPNAAGQLRNGKWRRPPLMQTPAQARARTPSTMTPQSGRKPAKAEIRGVGQRNVGASPAFEIRWLV
jgi:hypothetical protein